MGFVMRYEAFSFGSLDVDGKTWETDLVVDRGQVRRRRKKPSKPFRAGYGHTPVSTAEAIPWDCKRLVIGTGAHGALPVMPEVMAEAERRGVEVVAVPTEKAIAILRRSPKRTNAILHITC